MTIGTGTIKKEVLGVYPPGSMHMVGDGFPVRNMIPGSGVGEQLSPFLLLDYMGPEYFRRRIGVLVWVSIRIGDLKQSRLCIRAVLRIVIQPEAEASSVRVTCNG